MFKNLLVLAGIFALLFSCSDSEKDNDNPSVNGDNSSSSNGDPNNGDPIGDPIIVKDPIFIGKSPVVFNEVYAANTSLTDEFGKTPDWLELYNPGDTSVNLKDYSLTNDKHSVYWFFGNVVIPSRSYLVVFLSGKNWPNLTSSNNVHVPFELSNEGGKLFLMGPKPSIENIRDSIAYPSRLPELSYAKKPESSEWAYSKPTPKAANSGEFYSGQTQKPLGIQRSGHYEELSMTLPAETEQGAVYCDTTGALPTKSSALKSGVELNLKKTTVLRCAQFKDGAYPSESIMRTYIIGRLTDLPIVSIAANPTDFKREYAKITESNKNYDFELPIHVDFFERSAVHKWSYPAELGPMGAASRQWPQKSVKISFKEKYGQKNLQYPLFPDFPQLTKFKHFILRNNGNNWENDYIRDMLMTSITDAQPGETPAKGLGIDYQKGRAVVVYYNGEYYGIHNMRERSNSDYFETNYNYNEDYIDLLKTGTSGYSVSRGSDADYLSLLKWLEGVSLTDAANLKTLEEKIDIDNFTNHFQCRIYYNDADWPGNNVKIWRSNSPSTKWRYFMYDTDHGFGSWGIEKTTNMLALVTDANSTSWPNPKHSTLILRKLLENQNYKNAFINRFSLLIATYFAPTRVNAKIEALIDDIRNERDYDLARWPGKTSNSRGHSTIRDFASDRPYNGVTIDYRNIPAMQSQITSHFNLGSPVDFTISASGNGNVLVDNLQVLNKSAKFKAYPSVPVTLKAVPNAGAKFSKWSDGNTNAERKVDVNGTISLTAEFN